MSDSHLNQPSTAVVVGAGIAGLQTARALTKRGFDVLVLEQSGDIGGLPARCTGAKEQDEFAVQVPYEYYQFPEWPWPEQLKKSHHPTSSEINQYVRSYAEHFDLLPHIRFNCQLARIQQRKPSGWFVIYLNLDSSHFEEVTTDYVVVCTGMCTLPHVPSFQGSRLYKGLQLHSKQFSDVSVTAGKKVVVMGAGKAALDRASQVAMSRGAASVTWLFRQTHWPVPPHITKGLPMEKVVFSKLPNLLLPPYYSSGKLRRAVQGLLAPGQRLAWRRMQSSIKKQLGLEGSLEPTMPLEQDLLYGGTILDGTWEKVIDSNNAANGNEDSGASSSSSGSSSSSFSSSNSSASGSRKGPWKGLLGPRSSTGGTTGSSLQRGSSSGSSEACEPQSGPEAPVTAIQPVRGEVAQFTENGIKLKDGRTLEADVVLYCTGYTKSYDYLEGSVKARLGLCKDGLYLYRSVLAPQIPGLAFVGSEVSTYNVPLTSGLQAEWLARVLLGEVVLPPVEAMQADIRNQQHWRRSLMPAQRNRASVYNAYMPRYHSQLMKDMGSRSPKPGLLKPLASRDYAQPFLKTPASTLRERPCNTEDSLASKGSEGAHWSATRIAHGGLVCEATKHELAADHFSAMQLLQQRCAAMSAAAMMLQGVPAGTSAAEAVAKMEAAAAAGGGMTSFMSDGSIPAAPSVAVRVMPPQQPVKATVGHPSAHLAAAGSRVQQGPNPLLRTSLPEADKQGARVGAAAAAAGVSAPLPRLNLLSAALLRGPQAARVQPSGGTPAAAPAAAAMGAARAAARPQDRSAGSSSAAGAWARLQDRSGSCDSGGSSAFITVPPQWARSSSLKQCHSKVEAEETHSFRTSEEMEISGAQVLKRPHGSFTAPQQRGGAPGAPPARRHKHGQSSPLPSAVTAVPVAAAETGAAAAGTPAAGSRSRQALSGANQQQQQQQLGQQDAERHAHQQQQQQQHCVGPARAYSSSTLMRHPHHHLRTQEASAGPATLGGSRGLGSMVNNNSNNGAPGCSSSNSSSSQPGSGLPRRCASSSLPANNGSADPLAPIRAWVLRLQDQAELEEELAAMQQAPRAAAAGGAAAGGVAVAPRATLGGAHRLQEDRGSYNGRRPLTPPLMVRQAASGPLRRVTAGRALSLEDLRASRAAANRGVAASGLVLGSCQGPPEVHGEPRVALSTPCSLQAQGCGATAPLPSMAELRCGSANRHGDDWVEHM